MADFNTYGQEFLRRTVFSDICRSWYKNGKSTGSAAGMYVGSFLDSKVGLNNIGVERLDIIWRSNNRFRWLGNGESIRNEGGFGDLAY